MQVTVSLWDSPCRHSPLLSALQKAKQETNNISLQLLQVQELSPSPAWIEILGFQKGQSSEQQKMQKLEIITLKTSKN